MSDTFINRCEMKKLIFLISLLTVLHNCKAATPPTIIKRFRLIVKLIKEDKIVELADLVEYPLKRENPLPNLKNANEFIAYKKILFDKDLISKIQHFNDSDIFEHNGVYGLVGGPFDGDIWIDENGKITGFNHSSAMEAKLRVTLTKKIQSQTYPTVNKWISNVVVCKSEKLLIRIDRTIKGLRYVSWSKGHSINDKPDLILFNGVEDAQGTQGGRTWTFLNGDWTYIIDDAEMCQTPKECGYFLELLYKGVEKSRVPLNESK